MPHTSQKLDPTQRAEYIIDCLLNNGYVQVKDLAIEMSVDESTVRRDLSELAEKGLLKRVYGGATHV
ncbi:MAG: DeoR/GlpR transcriptional regulator, partial [Anaerolineae bacterium]|nr:DeoR/GlpR transcriptional regulator [Anaerolineae bacterium]